MTDTQLILEKLNMMEPTMTGLKEDIANMEQKFTHEIGGIKQDIVGIKQDIVGIKQDMFNLDLKITNQVNNLSLLIENDISKKIDIIGEGHDFLKQRLEQAMHMEIKREKMELELVNLRMDVNKIKDHLDIA